MSSLIKQKTIRKEVLFQGAALHTGLKSKLKLIPADTNKGIIFIRKDIKKKNIINFLTENNVEIVASLPCYQKENVDCQRGSGVFSKSIKALKKLNENGYGINNNLLLNKIDFIL